MSPVVSNCSNTLVKNYVLIISVNISAKNNKKYRKKEFQCPMLDFKFLTNEGQQPLRVGQKNHFQPQKLQNSEK